MSDPNAKHKQDGFPEKFSDMSLISLVGGLSSASQIQADLASGAIPIGRSTLALAAFDGRDAMQDARDRRDTSILCLVLAAEELERRGYRLRRMNEFRRWLANPGACSGGSP